MVGELIAKIAAGLGRIFGGSNAEAESILRAVATRRGGAIRTSRVLRGTVLRLVEGNVTLEVSSFPTRTDTYTYWFARLPNGSLPIFSLRPRGVFGKTAVAIEPDFDDQFLVRTDKPDAVKRLWNRRRIAAMLDRFQTSSLSCRGNFMTLSRPWPIRSEADVVSGVELLLDLAGVDVYGLTVLGVLPGAAFEDDDWPYVRIEGSEGITVGPLSIDGVACTVARMPVEGTGQDVEPRGLGEGRLVRGDGHVEIRWPGIETDPARLGAAIEVLRALARGPQLGVFR